MRFMSGAVDATKFTQIKMERENNLKERIQEEEIPAYGAGSEFGREQREEARRKKYGMASKNYKPDDQPWLLKIGGKTGRKYKGIRGGGITENASYYVFTQAADGAFEAYPVEEWYNFTPVQRYKALSAEEAEEEFGRREKVMNYFSIMLRKRLTLDERGNEPVDGEEKAQEKKGKKKKVKNDLKLTDMDEWLSDSENESENSNEKSDDESGNKKKKPKKGAKGKGKQKKKEDKGSDDEAVEESDEGDFDDREVDYMSDSSSSSDGERAAEKESKQMQGVADEEGLHNLHVSDEDEEEEEGKEQNEEEKKEGAANTEEKAATDEKKPDPKAGGKTKPEKKGSSGESSAESSDSDFDDSKFQSAMFMQKAKKRGGSDNSAGSSRANTPTKSNGKVKRKQESSSLATTSNPMGAPPSKKSKLEAATNQLNALINSTSEGISEDAVRRYLMRKPMTTTELLQKFRSKRTGISGDHLVTTIAQILKKLNPERQTIKGKLYLSIKA